MVQLALAGRSLGAAHPLEEAIRVAAVTGYPWLVVQREKMNAFLATPAFDIRDLKRLFLRTQPAALDGLFLPDCDPVHGAEVEAICRDARRLGAPVVVLRVDRPDARLATMAEIAERWSCVLALAPSNTPEGGSFSMLRELLTALDHPALGYYLDIVALWRQGEATQPGDAERTVLLAVADVDGQGLPVLPGEGTVPLRDLLLPLRQGGYESLVVLALVDADPPPNAEALAGAGKQALSELLDAAGWGPV